jgi:hypothetical protein
VTNETWTSSDLHLLVKSTSYELTNIVQGPPPAELFKIVVPPEYTVRDRPNITVKGTIR